MGKLEFCVESDPATGKVGLKLTFPDQTFEYEGDLNALRLLAESPETNVFERMVGPAAMQDLRVDIRRIYLAVKKEFEDYEKEK